MRLKAIAPFVVGVLFGLLCVRLGFWQLSRAEEKRAMAAQIDAASTLFDVSRIEDLQRWQHVRLRGHWLGDQTVFLDNQIREQRAGFDVLTPFVLDNGGGAVLIDRGWMPAPAQRTKLPDLATPAGPLMLTGWVRTPQLGGFRLDDGKEAGRIWQRPDPAHFAARGLALAPWLILQDSQADDGLQREWPRPDTGIATHQGYALQWFSFATMSFGLVVWFGWRRWRRKEKVQA